jgi:protein gp37
MSGRTSIEWSNATWNPIRARLRTHENLRINSGKRALKPGTWGYHCERISPGCSNCYACAMNGRTLPAWGTGLDYTVPNRDKVEVYIDQDELEKPRHWKKPRLIFPCSMTDWCADFVTDAMRDRLLAVCALTPQHTYQFLTKRADDQKRYLSDPGKREDVEDAGSTLYNCCYANTQAGWPLPNVWLGVSCEDQQRADERIPHLLATPAAVRWVSYEPALGPVDFTNIRYADEDCECRWDVLNGLHVILNSDSMDAVADSRLCDNFPTLDWIVAGGESGPGARPCDLAWLRAVVQQCASAGVPCFVKQLGARPVEFRSTHVSDPAATRDLENGGYYKSVRPVLGDRKGGDPSEWPADLRVREMPAAAGARV